MYKRQVQRVSSSRVTVDERVTGEVKKGLLVLLGVTHDDTSKDVDYMVCLLYTSIANSGNRRNLEIDFFGGEPLMNFEVVKQLVEYGRKVEKTRGKNIRFTITTNGVLLDDEKIKYINENMHNRCV